MTTAALAWLASVVIVISIFSAAKPDNQYIRGGGN